MKKFLFLWSFLMLGAAFVSAGPVVDGKVSAGEYAFSKSVLDGAGSLSWFQDDQGGLTVALSLKTKGWAAVGFGAKKMSGASIYLGFVDSAGKAVFAEQIGKGHRHADSGVLTADKSQVARVGGVTVVEFHLPAGKLPFTGKSVPFITAFGDSADLTTFHNDNVDSGMINLQ